jgi:nucleoid-associated protein YgaU
MSLFDFVKDVGQKLGLGGGNPPAADDLIAEVKKLGLGAEDLSVVVDGDKVKVSGKAGSAEEREKIILAMGNVVGVAQVEEAIESETPTDPSTFYTVQKGDTLSAVAKMQYGNANLYPAIFEANKPMLSDPDKIYPGQMLRIPPR